LIRRKPDCPRLRAASRLNAPSVGFADSSPASQGSSFAHREAKKGSKMDAVEFIRSAQLNWFDRIRPYLLEASLNVGSGHGFFSRAARQAGIRMTSLEVAAPQGAVDRDELVLYDGEHMPFGDGAFDTAIAMYVLHHTAHPADVLREMKRVSSKRIVLVEELYHHLPGKLRLVLLDYSINSRGGLKSNIRWGSYLTRSRLFQLAAEGGWKVIHTEARRRLGFDEVLWIVDKA
jgi:SAM-dependent methyltransferase